jgi:nucleoid-associated protein YgaU
MNRARFPEAKDPAWSDWRRRQVTDFVRQTYLRVQAVRPKVLVTAALITWGNGPTSDAGYRTLDAYSRVFQDWRGWLEEGIIDAGIPMNYFRESTYATYLDRWTEFMKDNQGRRMLMSGLGVYLNTIPQTLAQLPRVLRPSAKGNALGGVAFYSYSATDSANTDQLPKPEFYTALGEYFGAPAAVPELPWKTQPAAGHLYGTLRIDGYPDWLKDGAGIVIRGAGKEVRRLTDASGFFGAVELDPGDYTVTVELNGQALHTAPARRVEAGKATEFPIALRAEDVVKALPALIASERPAYAPGDIVVIQGRNLAAAYAPATAVPLPLELAGTMVVVNGVAAPLFAADPDYIVFQLPFESAARWQIVARRAGVESLPMGLDAVPAAPVIRGVRRNGEYLEIYATGLGATDPPMPAGTAVPSSGLALPVTVLIGGVALQPEYAGVLPYQPASYQVNVHLPAGVSGGKVRLKVGEAVSPAVTF